MKKLLLLALSLTGCAGIRTEINFNKPTEYASQGFVRGKVIGRFKNVQEFRSILESLNYRETEKAR